MSAAPVDTRARARARLPRYLVAVVAALLLGACAEVQVEPLAEAGDPYAEGPGDVPEVFLEEVEALPPVPPYTPTPKPALTPADWDAIAERGPYDQLPPPDTASQRPSALDPAIAEGIGVAAWVLAVALLLAMVGYLIYRHRQRPDLAVTRTDYGTTDELLSATADELATGLATGLEAHDYRAAIRLRFGQVLQALRARGLLTWVPGSTNLEYERELPPMLRADFRDLSAGFSFATYAGRDVGEARYARFAAAAEAFLARARAPHNTPA